MRVTGVLAPEQPVLLQISTQELVPITLVRLVSNSAATGLLLGNLRLWQHGPDSRIGMAASGTDEQHGDGLLLPEYLLWQCKGAPDPLCRARAHSIATAAGIAASIWITGA